MRQKWQKDYISLETGKISFNGIDSTQYRKDRLFNIQKIIIINQKATVFRDRNSKKFSEEIAITDKDWKEIISYFEKIDLEKIPTLKDPTQKRFYDGAAIANSAVPRAFNPRPIPPEITLCVLDSLELPGL